MLSIFTEKTVSYKATQLVRGRGGARTVPQTQDSQWTSPPPVPGAVGASVQGSGSPVLWNLSCRSG